MQTSSPLNTRVAALEEKMEALCLSVTDMRQSIDGLILSMTNHQASMDSAQLGLSFRVAELEEVRGICNTVASAQTANATQLKEVRGMCNALLASVQALNEEPLSLEEKTKKKARENGALDAAIVRTMKSHKEMTHRQLVLEVMQQVADLFIPDQKCVKRRIENLINRDYLERDKDNFSIYKYLA
jgi:hypothetical protein